MTKNEEIIWEDLKEKARMAGYIIFNRKNLETEREYDEAVENLVKFEIEHGIL